MVEDTEFDAVILGTGERNSGYQRKIQSVFHFLYRVYTGDHVRCRRCRRCITESFSEQCLTDRLLSASLYVHFIVP